MYFWMKLFRLIFLGLLLYDELDTQESNIYFDMLRFAFLKYFKSSS